MPTLAYLRLATAVLATALPTILTATAFLPTLASAWSATSPSSPPRAEATASDSALALAEPHPARLGISPFRGHQTTLRLGKRECLKNGTNFCFESSSSRFCPGCGGCCELGGDEWCCKDEDATCCSGRVCCGAGETCCGDGCCSSGRSCVGEKCEAPVDRVTVTSTRTVHATRTHTEVEVVTVQVKVHVTSTVNSIITTTVTSELGTHTEVTYVTTVLIIKRSLPSPIPGRVDLSTSEPDIDEEGTSDAMAGELSRFWRKLFPRVSMQLPMCAYHSLASASDAQLCEMGAGLKLWRRQDDDKDRDSTSTSTVIITTTALERTTVKDSRTTTDLVTLTATTTIFQTSTRAIGARETVSVISIVTITSRVPTTQTVTSTSTWFLEPTLDDPLPPTTTSPPSPPPPSEPAPTSALPNRTIVGIGVGTGLASLALFLLALVLLRRSRRKRAEGRHPAMDYIIAPAPAPVPSPRRDAYYGGTKTSPGHSRALSAATTQVSSGRASPDPCRGAAGAGAGEGPGRTQRRSIPHPSSSTVGRMTRFVEREGIGNGIKG